MTGTLAAHAMFVDEYLPRFDFTHREHLVIDGLCEDVYTAVRELDMTQIHSALVDTALWVRSLPARIKGTDTPNVPVLRIADLFDNPDDPTSFPGWVGLAESPGSEVVFGAIGKFWQPDIEWMTIGHDEFAAFDEPGWGKIAAVFSITPYGAGRTLVTYEARTALTDEASRRRFRLYWGFVSRVVGRVMRALLEELEQEVLAERD